MAVEIDPLGINWLGVGAVVIMSLVLGFLWYGPFAFGKLWLRLAGLTEEQAKAQQAKSFTAAILGALVVATGLAVTLQWINVASGVEGGTVTFMAGLFLVAPVIFVDNKFIQKPVGLSLLNAGFHVVEFTIAGVILGAWP